VKLELWSKSKEQKLKYFRRQPEFSELYRIIFQLHEELEFVWEEQFAAYFGCFRKADRVAFQRFLDCGIVRHGAARVWCESCNTSRLVAFSCKARGCCPSCDTKRMILFAEHLHEEILQPVPHRHAVISLPKRIRAFFRYNRYRHGLLFTAAWKALKEYYQAVLPEGVPGAIMALHTAGSLLEYNSHLHCIVTDGVFLPNGGFLELGVVDNDKLQLIFEHKLLSLLKANNIISETVIAQIRSWKHSGFSVWLGPQIQPTDQDARLFISEYVAKAQVKMNRIEIIEKDSDFVIRYHKDEHTFKDYKPLQFLAQLSAQIPNRWEQIGFIKHWLLHYCNLRDN